MEPNWPGYVWKSANDDSVDQAYELASVISANLLTRFDPVIFDEAVLQSFSGDVPASVRRVLQGRTFAPESQLPKSMVLPGDTFELTGADAGEVWINVSPACHTLGRDGDAIRLHMVRGSRLDMPATKGAFSAMAHDHALPNHLLVHTFRDEHPYSFDFRESEMRPWEEIKEFRIGRLLPPFVTRLQQLNAAYMQSEGLPLVTFEIYAAHDASDSK
jgi:hypothetical protein